MTQATYAGVIALVSWIALRVLDPSGVLNPGKMFP